MNRSDAFIVTVVLMSLMAFYNRQEERRHHERLRIQIAAAKETVILRKTVAILTEETIAENISDLLDELESLEQDASKFRKRDSSEPEENLILRIDPFGQKEKLILQ